MAGWSATRSIPMSPAGQVEQWADLASGLTSDTPGGRRAARMLVGFVLLALGTGLVVLLV
jgi:hypothetical protein